MRFRTATGAAALVMHALLAVPFWWAGTAAQETPKSPLSRLLEAELGRFPGIAGLYVRHLATGEEASVRGEERFESASTIKVAIMAHIYRMADAGEIDLTERIELQRSDLVGGSGIFRYKGVGLNPSIRDLITEMIITSDNTATDMLLRRIGGVGPVNEFLEEQELDALRMRHTVYSYFRGLYERINPGFVSLSREDVYALCCANTLLGNVPSLAERRDSLNREVAQNAPAPGEQGTSDLLHPEENWFGVATPRAMGQLLERIETCTIASEASCEEMRRILRNTQASGTPIAGALAIHLSVPVGHKTGGTTGVTNDVGIIYARSGPVVIAFYNKEIAGPTAVADRVTLALQMSYLDSHFAYMGNDNNSFGFLPSAFFGGSNPDRAWGFQRPAQLFGRTFYQDTNRLTAGSTVTWDPFEWLSMRGTGGVDYYNRGDISFFARDIGVPGDRDRGRKDTDYLNQWQYTLDMSSTASFDLPGSITSRSTVGVQYFENQYQGTSAWGIDIVNGGSSIGLAAETFSSEFHTFEKTAGLFVDQQFGLNDRLFVTGAIRADDNSAFGQDFDLIFYPKAGLSWIASEEEFFPEIAFLDQLRFRGAWGKSGLQPGSDDAIRTLSATAITTPGDETSSGVSIGNIGNSLLEPERSSEIELGFDAEFGGGRAGLEFTYYDKRTDGALITVPLAPSLGASASRWVNIGEVQNRGFEATLTTDIVNTDQFGWDLTFSGSINQNELLSLGEGTEPIGSQTRFVPGFPLGGQWDRPIQSWSDTDGNGILTPDELVIGDTIEYIGPGQPENQLTISSNFQIFENINVYGLLDYRGNYIAYNNTERFRCRFRLCQALIDPGTPIDEQARAVASLLHPSQTVWGYMERGDFWKLREVSVRYTLPELITGRIGASRGTVTVSGRNLGVWTDYTGMDPEINWNGSGDNFGISEFLTQPPVRYYTARLNLTF